MIRIFVKLVAAIGIATLLLVVAGHYARSMVPEQYHQAGWMTGMIIFCMSVFAAAAIRRASPAKQRSLENLLLTGAVIGALLFVLFISQLECFRESSARGPALSCRYYGAH